MDARTKRGVEPQLKKKTPINAKKAERYHPNIRQMSQVNESRARN